MAAKIYIGIDLGTTVLKCCAFDSHLGAVVARSERRLPILSLPNGGREIRLNVLNRAFKQVVVEIKTSLGDRWRSIGAIGLASQAGSSLIANRKTGDPLTPMILWNDNRFHDLIRQLEDKIPKGFLQETILNNQLPAGLGRLLGLKELQPHLFCPENIHVGAGEYLFFQLTGVWRQDSGNAIQIGSYNAVSKTLFDSLFERIGVPLSFVAPLRRRHETAALSIEAAKALDLPPGLPVAGPYFDQESCYLSATGASERPLQISLGTAWVGNFRLPGDAAGSSPTQLVVDSPLDEGRLVVQPLLTGNLAWEWGLRQLIRRDLAGALSKAKEIFQMSPLPPSGLCAVPWFAQPNPFSNKAYGGGSFVGLSDCVGKDDLLRALAAGMVFELMRVFAELTRANLIDSVVIGGGASKGEHFCSMIASMFAPLPVFRQRDEDLAAARGSVFAFAKEIGQSRMERIKVSNAYTRKDIDNRFREYTDIFYRLYGTLPQAKSYQIIL